MTKQSLLQACQENKAALLNTSVKNEQADQEKLECCFIVRFYLAEEQTRPEQWEYISVKFPKESFSKWGNQCLGCAPRSELPHWVAHRLFLNFVIEESLSAQKIDYYLPMIYTDTHQAWPSKAERSHSTRVVITSDQKQKLLRWLGPWADDLNAPITRHAVLEQDRGDGAGGPIEQRAPREELLLPPRSSTKSFELNCQEIAKNGEEPSIRCDPVRWIKESCEVQVAENGAIYWVDLIGAAHVLGAPEELLTSKTLRFFSFGNILSAVNQRASNNGKQFQADFENCIFKITAEEYQYAQTMPQKHEQLCQSAVGHFRARKEHVLIEQGLPMQESPSATDLKRQPRI